MSDDSPEFNQKSVDELIDIARGCRREIVKMVKRANAGHPGELFRNRPHCWTIWTNYACFSFRTETPGKRPVNPIQRPCISSNVCCITCLGFLEESDLHSYRILTVFAKAMSIRNDPGVDFSGGKPWNGAFLRSWHCNFWTLIRS